MATTEIKDEFSQIALPVTGQEPAAPVKSQEDEFAGIAQPLPNNATQPESQTKPKDWRPYFSGVNNLPGTDNDSKYRSIVESYMADQMPNLTPEFISQNSQSVLDEYLKSKHGLQGDHFTYQHAYDVIGKSLNIDPKTISENNNPPWYWNKDAQAYGKIFSLSLPMFQKSIEQPIGTLPEPNPKYFPDIPSLGTYNPSLWAGIYTIAKTQLEGLSTPESLALMRIHPALGAASEANVLARTSLLSLQGLLVGVIFKSTYDQYPEIKKIINDPKSTTAERWKAIGVPATNVVQALISAHEAIYQAGELGREILANYKNYSSVKDAIKDLRDKASKTKDIKLATALDNAADELDTVSNKPIPDDKPEPEEILSPDVLRKPSEVPKLGEGVQIKGLEENSGKAEFDQARKSVIEVIHNLQSLDANDKERLVNNLETGGVVQEPGTGPVAMQVSDQIPEVQNPQKLSDITDRPEVQQEIDQVNQDIGIQMNQINLALREALELAGVYDPELTPANRARLTPAARAKLQTAEVKAKFAAKKEELINKANEKLDALREQQRARVAKIKADAEAKYGKLKTRATEKIESLKFADQEGRADYQAIRRSLLDLSNLLPANKRGKYLAQITDALSRPMITNNPEGMYSRAMNVSFNLLNELDKVERQGIVDRINKKVQKSLDSPTVDIDYKAQIQNLVKEYTFDQPSENTLNQLRRTQAYLDRVGNEAGLPASVIQNLQLLSKTNANELPVNVLRGLEDEVDLQIKLGQKKYSSIQARYEREKAELKNTILSGPSNKWEPSKTTRVPGSGDKDFGDRTSENAIKAIDYSVSVGRSLLTKDVNFNNLEGNDKNYNGQLSRTFINRTDLNYGAEINLEEQATAPLKDIVKKHNLTENNAERISIYAISQQEGGAERLLASGVKDPKSVVLTPGEMEFYKTARTMLDEVLYPMIKRTMKELYNVDVPKVENYWPYQRDHTLFEQEPNAPKMRFNKGQELDLNNFSLWPTLEQDFIPTKSTKTEKGFTIERKPEAEGAVKLNAFSVMDDHIRKTAHMVTNQRDLKMLGEIARSPEFAAKYGRDGQKYVLGFLDTIARNGHVAGATRNVILDTLNRHASVAAIGYRAISNLKHVTNVPFALQFVNSDHLLNAVNEVFSDRGKAFLKQNFPEVYTRAGGEFSIADLSDGTAWEKIQNAGFEGEKLIDSVISRAAVLGRYTQELEAKGLDWRNYDQVPIDKEAQGLAIRISRQVVTSPLPKDLPSIIARSKNPSYIKAIFAFQNTMLRQWSYINQELVQKGIVAKDAKQGSMALLVMMSVLASETTLERASRSLTSSDTVKKPGDSFFKDLMVNTFRRVPGVGNLIAAAFYNETGINLIDTTVKGIHSAAKLMYSKNGKPLTTRESVAAELQTAETIASLSGFPGAGTIFGLAKKFLVPEKETTRNPSKSFRSTYSPGGRFATEPQKSNP